jgi:hypothetical protein
MAEPPIERIAAIFEDPFAEFPGLSDMDRAILRGASEGMTESDLARAYGTTRGAMNLKLLRLRRANPGLPKLRQIQSYVLAQIRAVLDEALA